VKRIALGVDCARITDTKSVETDVAAQLGTAVRRLRNATEPITLDADSFAATFNDLVEKVSEPGSTAQVVVYFVGVDEAERRGINIMERLASAIEQGTTLHAIVALYRRRLVPDCAAPFDRVLLSSGEWEHAAPGAAAVAGAGGGGAAGGGGDAQAALADGATEKEVVKAVTAMALVTLYDECLPFEKKCEVFGLPSNMFKDGSGPRGGAAGAAFEESEGGDEGGDDESQVVAAGADDAALSHRLRDPIPLTFELVGFPKGALDVMWDDHLSPLATLLMPLLKKTEEAVGRVMRTMLHPIVGYSNVTVVLAQASGSGKTKIAVHLGLEHVVTILIRLGAESPLTLPWMELDSKLNVIAGLHLKDSDRAQQGGAYLRTLILCYVEWTVLVLRKAHELFSVPANPPEHIDAGDWAVACVRIHNADERVRLFRFISLVSNRNGKGDEGVTSLARTRFAYLSTAFARGESVEDASMRYAEHVKKAWGGVCVAWGFESPPLLHLSFDEIQAALSRWTNVFRRKSAPSEAADGFHALLDADCVIRNCLGSVSSACGTHLSLEQRISTHSVTQVDVPLTPTVRVLTQVTVDDMWGSLRRHLRGLDGLSNEVEDTITRSLDLLCGRPVWFFRHTWEALVRELHDRQVCNGRVEEGDMASVVLAAVERGTAESRKKLRRIVETFDEVENIHARDQLMLMFQRAFWEESEPVRWTRKDITHAVATGLIATGTGRVEGNDDDVVEFELIDEPLLADAIYEYCAIKHKDIVMSALRAVGDSAGHPSTRGFLWEKTVALHILSKAYKRRVTVAQVYKGWMPAGFIMPELASKAVLHVNSIRAGQRIHFQALSRMSLVVNMHQNAGADLVHMASVSTAHLARTTAAPVAEAAAASSSSSSSGGAGALELCGGDSEAEDATGAEDVLVDDDEGFPQGSDGTLGVAAADDAPGASEPEGPGLADADVADAVSVPVLYQCKSSGKSLFEALVSVSLGLQFMTNATRCDVLRRGRSCRHLFRKQRTAMRAALKELRGEVCSVRIIASHGGFQRRAVDVVNWYNTRYPSHPIVLVQSPDQRQGVQPMRGPIRTDGAFPADALMWQPLTTPGGWAVQLTPEDQRSLDEIVSPPACASAGSAGDEHRTRSMSAVAAAAHVAAATAEALEALDLASVK
jgi:hypothetical protein